MWVIIRWIRNNAYPLTALMLFLFSFNLVLQYQLYQHSFYFNKSVSFFRFIDETRTGFTRYLNLKSENDILTAENLRLRTQLSTSFNTSQASFDTTLTDTSIIPAKTSNYTFHVAQVIRASTTSKDNYFYIDKGSIHGIEKGMAVLSPSGIAGIVLNVSHNYARVMAVIHSKFEITPFISALNLRQGVVKWETKDARFGSLNEINKTETIIKGHKLTTSNYSAIFPPGIPIGTVVTVNKDQQNPYLGIKIQFATDFSRLDHVYCVKNNTLKEIEQLESTESND